MTKYIISLQSWSRPQPKRYVTQRAPLRSTTDPDDAQRFDTREEARTIRDRIERTDEDVFAKVEEV